MAYSIRKDLKMEPELARKIQTRAKAEGMNFSQFMRYAAIQLLKRKQIA